MTDTITDSELQKLEQQVRDTPSEVRPTMDENGTIAHMNDRQFLEYLKFQKEIESMPKPAASPEDRLSRMEAQLAGMEAAYQNGVKEA